jgi:hypothetical protein
MLHPRLLPVGEGMHDPSNSGLVGPVEDLRVPVPVGGYDGAAGSQYAPYL